MDNKTILTDWKNAVEEGIMHEYEKHGIVRNGYFIIFPEGDKGSYTTKSIRNFGMDTEALMMLVEQNFRHGTPIMAIMTAIMLQDKDKEVLMLTYETPLERKKYIYTILEVEGKKKLIYDGFLSKYIGLGKTALRFTYLLDTNQSTLS